MDYAERESLLLAPYAMRASESAGRADPEPDHPYRSAYQRDRDRITHSSAFRRLSQKTQVFTGELVWSDATSHRGDYHRTRLTHTLEVASIARTIARALRLNEDLVEALALAHDVGHPPFGHAGEEVLDELLAEEGGFNHNRQAVRIFQRLEHRYPDRRGLNLTAEVMESQHARGDKANAPALLLEAQVVDAADSIAYDSHDADDALEIGLVSFSELEGVTLWRESAEHARQRHTSMTSHDLRRATVHELIDRQVSDLVTSLRNEIEAQQIESVDQVRRAGLLVRHSLELGEKKKELEAFLFRQVYRHPIVLEHRAEAGLSLRGLYHGLLADPASLPAPFSEIAVEESPARAVGDYVSSLTDRAVLDRRGVTA